MCKMIFTICLSHFQKSEQNKKEHTEQINSYKTFIMNVKCAAFLIQQNIGSADTLPKFRYWPHHLLAVQPFEDL